MRYPKVKDSVSGTAGSLQSYVRRITATAGSDRGDVPGWVLVTLMSAGLVVALWALAGPALGNLFMDAINGVQGP